MIMKSISDKKNKNYNIPTQDEQVLENELNELETQLVNMKSTTQTIKKKSAQKAVQQDDDMMDIDQEESAWKLYENWKPCPMGTLPNGKVPCLDISILLKN